MTRYEKHVVFSSELVGVELGNIEKKSETSAPGLCPEQQHSGVKQSQLKDI
jgi:hypothetical protein